MAGQNPDSTCSQVARAYARDGQAVCLRPVTMGDANILFAWQNEPGTRRFARNPQPPSLAEHLQWLVNRLGEPNTVLLIMECEGQPVGMLRLDPFENGSFEISILVASKWQKKGVARAALTLARKLRPAATIRAKVLPGNTASHALFQSAGYREKNGWYVGLPADGKPIVAFYVDVGKGAGLGHARRCITLAETLQDAGLAPQFFADEEVGVHSIVAESGFPLFPCGTGIYRLVDMTIGAEVLIVDHYAIDLTELRNENRGRRLLVAFDDACDRPLPVDILINGSPAAAKLPYEQSNVGRLLLGPCYQVVRSDLRSCKPCGIGGATRRIVVTIGGADPLGIAIRLTQFMRESVCPTWPNVQVHMIFGPEVILPDGRNPPNLILHHAPPNFAQIICTAEIAISASGQTLLELVYCGIPTIAFAVAGNQVANLEALSGLGCVCSVGWANEDDWLARLERVLSELLCDGSARERLSLRCRGVIDGRGAETIAREISDALGIANGNKGESRHLSS